MTLAVVSLVINSFITLSLFFSQEYHELSLYILPFCVVHLIGVVLIALGSKKVGAYIVFASAIAFVPIGVIGIIGARKILDQLKIDEMSTGNKG